jgi:tRNA threonylcarbamoyladenosine biosynthesis protein TsaE
MSLDLTQATTVTLSDAQATERLGAAVAAHLKRGDVVYLKGDLGAGKSTLARGLIRHLTTPDQDVPSPTFVLMQTYETPAFDICHLDLYRLETSAEIYELGLDEALSHSVLLIEWPERLGDLGFDDHLEIALEIDSVPSGRTARLTPNGRFRPRP